jgi:hypothetical protein
MPSDLVFFFRYHIPLDVYVARSTSADYSKIGIAEDAANRIESLDDEGYGSVFDWELLDVLRCENAARVDGFVATQFSDVRVPLYWMKHGVPAVAFEVFDELPEYLAEANRSIDFLINRQSKR